MMDGWNNGMDAAWWVVMSLFWIGLIALIVWAVVRLFPGRGVSVQTKEARDVLDRRLASGDIDTATYDQLRDRLDRRGLAGGR